MKPRQTFAAFVLPVLCLIGCASDPADGPRYSSRLNVTYYTSATFAPTAELDVYEPEQIAPPHKIIAMISREGHARDEGLILNAIAWKARQLGADAIVRLPLRDPQTHYSSMSLQTFSSAKTESQQPVWRVNAIKYLPTQSPQSATPPTASKVDAP